MLALLAQPILGQSPKNILFVVVDDLPVHVEPYLSESHPLRLAKVPFTPYTAELAKESVVFHRAYAQNAAYVRFVILIGYGSSTHQSRAGVLTFILMT